MIKRGFGLSLLCDLTNEFWLHQDHVRHIYGIGVAAILVSGGWWQERGGTDDGKT
jgi:hypothetical protein